MHGFYLTSLHSLWPVAGTRIPSGYERTYEQREGSTGKSLQVWKHAVWKCHLTEHGCRLLSKDWCSGIRMSSNFELRCKSSCSAPSVEVCDKNFSCRGHNYVSVMVMVKKCFSCHSSTSVIVCNHTSTALWQKLRRILWWINHNSKIFVSL